MTPIRFARLFVLFLIPAFASAQDPKAIHDTFFPNPDTTFTTPAFAKKKGFTTSKMLFEFLDAHAGSDAGWNRDTIGYSAKGVPIVAVQKGGETATAPIKLLMLGGIHGDEPAGTEGLLAMIQQLGPEGPWEDLLDSVTLRIVPMVNPDGMDKLNRYAANGRDLNRDQSKLTNVEMIALKEDFRAFDADIVIDFHEYRPYRADYVDMGEFGVTSPFDVMFMYTGNLNVPEVLRTANETLLVNPAREAMDGLGRRYANYFRPIVTRGVREFRSGGTSPRSSVTSFGLANSLSVLLEIRGVGLGRRDFPRRVETAYTLAHSFLQSAALQGPAIHAVRQQAAADDAPVVIEAARMDKNCDVILIDLHAGELRSFSEKCSDSNAQYAVTSRKRPGGYVVMPEAAEAIEKLGVLGLEATVLEAPVESPAEAYEFTEDRLSGESFEGFFERIVTAETRDTTVVFPEGSVWLSADQPRFPLTFELLEPEASNGFLRFRVLDPAAGTAYPVFRILAAEKHRFP
jgi:hypothetical protein